MEISTADFERHFASLSDEALLAIVRKDLVDSAKVCLDREISGRGLNRTDDPAARETEPAEETGRQDFVDIAEFDTAEEGKFARQMLEGQGISSYLSDDGRDPADGPRHSSLEGRHLMVPAEAAEEVLLMLAAPISDEELAAQAEAAAGADEDEGLDPASS